MVNVPVVEFSTFTEVMVPLATLRMPLPLVVPVMAMMSPTAGVLVPPVMV